MHRLITAGAVAAAALTIAACSLPFSQSSASNATPTPTPSGGPGRNGASGELVKIDGTTLVVNSQAGDVTVVYDTSTTFDRTSTVTLADIAVGMCITAPGTKDSTGAVTATGVQLRNQSADGTCGSGVGPGGNGAPGASPRPTQASPRPSPSIDPNAAFVSGEVTAVSGVHVTVRSTAGTAESVTVPTTVAVTRSDTAAASDLALHECINANGTRDDAGKVTARSIAIVPAGPSGCGTGGGRGNFGGGGRGNGNGRGGPPPGGQGG